MAVIATQPAIAEEHHSSRRGPRLWAHAAALAVVLTVALPLMHPTSSFTSDEGAYALQVDALTQGTWAYDYRAAPLDPTGKNFPLVNTIKVDGKYYPYISHPTYPVLLRGAVAALGQTAGLHLWPLLGTIGVAIAAWLLAGQIDPRLRSWAFWLAAASPALANAYLLWAHTVSAAVAGLTLVAVVRTVREGPTLWRTVAVAAGLAAGVLLRSEGLLFAAAVAITLTIVEGRRSRGQGTAARIRGTALTFAATAGPAVATMLVERAWVRRIASGTYENLRNRSANDDYILGRISGAWHDLFQGPTLTFVALAVVVGFGLVALRRWDTQSPVAIGTATLAAIGLGIVQYLQHPSEPISGLFAATPVLLLGVLLIPWRSAGSVERTLGAVAALFSVAVVATSYPDGGGLQWGGRFFSPLLAPLAVLAVLGLDRRLPGVRAERRAVTGMLAAAVAAGAVLSLLTVGQLRQTHEEITAAVRRNPATVTVTTVPALARVAWTADRDITWMLADEGELEALLSDLRAQGVSRVAVVADLNTYPNVQPVPEPALRDRGLALFQLTL